MKLTVLVVMSGVLALAAESGMEMYQRAVTLERQGKLRDAVTLYEKVAKDFAKDRPLAAKALVQAASGYEKLGQDNALKLYDRVASEFTDQAELARSARAKANALRVPVVAPRREVQIDLSAGIRDVVATDGREVIYWDGSDLVKGDVAGRIKRVIFKATAGGRPSVYPSQDLAMTLLYFPPTAGQPSARWSVMKTEGIEVRDLPQVSGPAEIVHWSWDKQYALLIRVGVGMAKVTIATGEVREIRNPVVGNAELSPDNRFIVFQSMTGMQVMPADGGEPKPLGFVGGLAGWTRDGQLLFGKPDADGKLWTFALAMRNGEPAGEPTRLFEFTLPALPWVTESGTVVVRRGGNTGLAIGQPQVRTIAASLGADKQVGPWQILELATNGLYPDWSADGTQLLYVAREVPTGRSTVHSVNVSSGLDRELNRFSGFLDQCFWSPRPSEVFCSGRRPNPFGVTTEVLSVPTNGDAATRLAMVGGVNYIHYVTADGKFLEMLRIEPVTHHKVEIATGTDTVRTGGHLSRDGRREFEVTNDVSGQVFSVRAVGSEWKRVPGFNQPRSTTGPIALKFTPDGEWVFYQSKEADGRFGLYRASTSTGVPERLGDFPSPEPGGWLSVSPDGRRIVLQVPMPTTEEFTLLENFLPRVAERR